MRTAVFLLAISTAASAQITVTCTYQDRVYNAGGFTGAQPMLPIRQAEVEIINANTMLPVASGATNESGVFSATPAPSLPNVPVFARVYARRTTAGFNISVRNNPAAGAQYTAVSATQTTSGAGNASLSIALTVAGGAPPFNIFDCAVRSFQYQASVTAVAPVLVPMLTIFWQAGSNNGTYFDNAPNAVFLLGTAADPDQYDDDIILHEIGHWVSFNFSKDDTLGGPHSVVQQLDPRTSWSEGWAHYWSSAVRRFFSYASPHMQVDNFGTGNSVFEIETPDFSAQAIMATNELAVAAVLWDLIDPANEAFDLLAGAESPDGNEQDVWEAVSVRMPLRTNITLEDFREGLAVEAPGIMGSVTGAEGTVRILNSRSILYFTDSSEANNAPSTSTVLTADGPGLPRRTLFVAGDEDWFLVDTNRTGTLVAETLNLGDGANTVLQLFTSDGSQLLASNDDRTPSDRSSQIRYPVGDAGRFLLRVVRSGDVVENGYYDIVARLGPLEHGPAPQAGYCGGAAPAGAVPRAGLLALLAIGVLACSRRRS